VRRQQLQRARIMFSTIAEIGNREQQKEQRNRSKHERIRTCGNVERRNPRQEQLGAKCANRPSDR